VQHARTVSTGWDADAGAWGSRSVGTRGRGVRACLAQASWVGPIRTVEPFRPFSTSTP
jgi:hypothetical protein